eukprot:SAG25_NODE_340_length_9458_cov_4.740571_1_plen_329_part_00
MAHSGRAVTSDRERVWGRAPLYSGFFLRDDGGAHAPRDERPIAAAACITCRWWIPGVIGWHHAIRQPRRPPRRLNPALNMAALPPAYTVGATAAAAAAAAAAVALCCRWPPQQAPPLGLSDVHQLHDRSWTQHKQLLKIVLTGGPGGGKTTAMERMRDFLSDRGFRVYTVPEAATILFSNGLAFADFDTEDKVLEFQTAILKTQMHLEDTFEQLARTVEKPSVLLCDRGAMDGSAYCSADSWRRLMSKTGLSSVEVREGRYNAVFHLQSAAEGAEAFYSNAGGHRLETAEEARELDKKVLAAWVVRQTNRLRTAVGHLIAITYVSVPI